MTSILTLFGFPPPEKRDAVRFYLAKNLPYNPRLYLMLILLAVGFGLQILFMNAIYGAFFLLAGIVLVLVKGYDSRVRIKGFSLDPNWKTVSIDKIQEIEQLRKRSIKWDCDFLDISNPLGIISLILIGGLALVASFFLGILANDSRVTNILATDIAIFIIPLWFSGMRFILKQPNLAIRVKIILELYEVFKTTKLEGEELRPALMLTKGDKGESVPIDARFSIVFPNSPEGFYGLQAQINLNVVQGTSYPYFYCALAAKPGFGLSQYKDKIKHPEIIICEYQEDSKAEVLVIRQHTTKKSGYHTKDLQRKQILMVALETGRKITETEQQFRTACKKALADGRLSLDEKHELKMLAKSLNISPETMKKLFEEEKKNFLRNRKEKLAREAEQQFRTACKKALANGKLTFDEQQELKSLAESLKISNKSMKQILKDEVKIFRQSHFKKHSG